MGNRVFVVSDMGTVIEAAGVFTSDVAANAFMEGNEGLGLLHSNGGVHYVARMGDPVPPMLFFRDQDGNTLLIVENQDQQ